MTVTLVTVTRGWASAGCTAASPPASSPCAASCCSDTAGRAPGARWPASPAPAASPVTSTPPAAAAARPPCRPSTCTRRWRRSRRHSDTTSPSLNCRFQLLLHHTHLTIFCTVIIINMFYIHRIDTLLHNTTSKIIYICWNLKYVRKCKI